MGTSPKPSSMLDTQRLMEGMDIGLAEKRVAAYVRAHGREIISIPLSEISRACNVSDATVVRFCRHLGYKGLKDFKIALASEQNVAQQSADLPIDWNDTLPQLKEKVFAGCIKALQCSSVTLSDTAVIRAVEALNKADNIDVYAVGGSVPIASYLRHQLMKLGIRSSVYSDSQSMQLSFSQLGENDVALAISCSGKTQEVVRALSSAASLGATTLCLTNSKQSPLAREASISMITSGNRFFGEDYNTYSRLSQLAVVDILYAGLIVMRGQQHQDKLDSRNRTAKA